MSAGAPPWPLARAHFRRLCDLADAERVAALRELEATEPELAAHVADLLRGDRPADDLADAVELLRADFEHAVAPPPSHAGPWRLEARIGTGGMGEVWRARRDGAGFVQLAAIKLLKRGMDSEALLGRFLQERRILARLEHPDISRLLDGGVCDDGRPFFAMELVDGQPIGDYVDARQPPLAELLRLFVRICRSVDYAHRNLVVHRDLKPSNILVTADGAPKLLDFGIAKLIEGDGDDSTQTAAQWSALTPAYAAPEQLRGEPVTTATDVYALGVVLFQLLTGELPHPRATRTRAALLAAQHQQVPRPSAVLQRGGASGAIEAGMRRRQFARQLRGDLDAIVLTALQHAPARRYPSAAALAQDLERFLAGRPVLARPDGAGYRLRRFVGRNRFAVGAATLALAALLAGLGSALWQAGRAAEEARRAEAVKHFLVELFEVSNPDLRGGSDPRASDLLEAGSARIAQRFEAQLPLKRELLALLGDLTARLGDPAGAGRLFDEALAVDARLGDGEGSMAAALHTRLAATLAARSELDDARRHAAQAIAQLRNGRTAARRAQLADALAEAGSIEIAARDLAAARAHLQEALAIDRGLHPDGVHPSVARDLRYLGQLETLAGDLAVAERLTGQVLALVRQLHGSESTDYAAALHDHGVAHVTRGQHDRAAPLLAEALALRRRLLGDAHPQTIRTLRSHAGTLRSNGRLPEIEPELRAALAALAATFGDDHPDRADIHTLLAFIEVERGNAALAYEHNAEAVRIYQAAFGADHQRTALARSNGVRYLRTLGRLELALDEARTARDSLGRGMGERHALYAVGSVQLALVHVLREEHALAAAMLADAVELFEAQVNPASADAILMRIHWANALRAGGELAGARVVLDALAAKLPALPPGHAAVHAWQLAHGHALLDGGEPASAAEAIAPAVSARCTEGRPPDQACAEARLLLASALQASGREHDDDGTLAGEVLPLLLDSTATAPELRRLARGLLAGHGAGGAGTSRSRGRAGEI